MKTAAVRGAVLALLLMALGALAWAPPTPEEKAAEKAAEKARAEAIRAGYAKYEYRVPMRDGTKLFTAVYVPNDASATRTYPILLVRTPYSLEPYGLDRFRKWIGPTTGFEDERFIFVLQDVRGRFRSEGEFVNLRPIESEKSGKQFDESSDAYDTIDWLVRNVEHNNGKVGLWGLSYPGFYASAGMIDSHPALVAVSPQAPIADWFWDDMHRHGAFNLLLTFTFFSRFGVVRPEPTEEWPEKFDFKTPDTYQFFLDLGPLRNANERHLHGKIPFWNDMAAHPDYDSFWRTRNVLPHLRGIRAAVLVVGGWFDTEDLYGALHTYEAVERQNPGIASTLVMGPWSHGAWLRDKGERLGTAEFGAATSLWFREHVLLPFFRERLKGEGTADLPEALVFETGANRWRRFDAWPPRRAQERSLYLRADGRLAWEPPPDEKDAFDEYTSDPSKPVPYTAEVEPGWSRTYMTEDQRFAGRRPDVLVYRSEPLAEDVTVAGPLDAELFVDTTGGDADFVVKLIDELPGSVSGLTTEEKETYPGGRQMLVRGEPFRGRYRDGYDAPKPFVRGQVARVAFRINDVLHTFARGHRIMVQVQSSWFPYIDRNPQSWVANIFEARESDFVKAVQRIHRARPHASRIRLRTLPPP